jgi:diketogulonate reductase-like aldo/keto reductase
LTQDKSEVVIDTEAPGIVETWKAVVDIYQKSGKVKAIGVSNFTKKHLEMIIEATGVVPAVNQIEAHPGLQQDDLEGKAKRPSRNATVPRLIRSLPKPSLRQREGHPLHSLLTSG